MSRTRRANPGEVGIIYDPITYTDVDAWIRLTGVDLVPWEVDTLLKVDALWIAQMYRDLNANAKKRAAKAK